MYWFLFLAIGSIVVLTTLLLVDDSDDFTLITRDTEVSGWISNIDRQHGMLYFNIRDTLKYKISGHMSNYEYTQDSFFDFLTGGDWFEKKRGTDTLLIRRRVSSRQNNSYTFVLGQELHKDLIKKTDN
jgi:hypothetical protein